MTLEYFEKFIFLPENSEWLLEYVGGEVVEQVSTSYASFMGGRILGHIFQYIEANDLSGYMTAANGGYQIAGDRYIPDGAYIIGKLPLYDDAEIWSVQHPALVIEVVSPTERLRDILIKIANYLSEGATVLTVDLEHEEVRGHSPGEAVQIFTIEDTLNVENILPGFELSVRTLFKK